MNINMVIREIRARIDVFDRLQMKRKRENAQIRENYRVLKKSVGLEYDTGKGGNDG